MVPRSRRAVGVVLAASGLGLAACSGAPSASPPSGPPARLGSSLTAWQATRPAAGGSGYGRTVTVDGASRAQYSDVTTAAGKVTGWHQAFPAGTRLARAEAAVRAALPTDARQTASWRGTFARGEGLCEFVNYQSVSLAGLLGTAAPDPSGSNIGARFYEATSPGPASTSIADINSAQVSTAPATQGESC